MLAPPGADDLADVVGLDFQLAPHSQQAQLDGGPRIKTDPPHRLATRTNFLPAEAYGDVAESPGTHYGQCFRQRRRPGPQKQGAVLGSRELRPVSVGTVEIGRAHV